MVFIWLIAYGNLLGVRESGRIFAFPTYIFIVSLYLTGCRGLYEVLYRPSPALLDCMASPSATARLDVGCRERSAIFIVMRAFASGARR